MGNREAWAGDELVKYYTEHERELRWPERVILEQLRPQLPVMAMLDLGVGGGRTTAHFAPLVQRYVGVDYSETMISACRRRFAANNPSYAFMLADATELSCIGASEFDFVFFSLNGIDCVGHADRQAIFKEVRRVSKRGAFFCFSTHNIRDFPARFGWRSIVKAPRHQRRASVNRYCTLHLKRNSPLVFLRALWAPWVVVRDDVHDYALALYYVRPEAQLKELEGWCSTVTVFGCDARVLDGGSEVRTARDPWLYYLCQVS